MVLFLLYLSFDLSVIVTVFPTSITAICHPSKDSVCDCSLFFQIIALLLPKLKMMSKDEYEVERIEWE